VWSILGGVTATTAQLPADRAERPSALRYPISRRFLRDLGYMVLTLGTSVVAFTLLVAGLSVTLSLAILIVGVPVAILNAIINREWAGVQRRLSGWALGEPIRAAYRPAPQGLLARLRTVLADPQTWRDLLWLAFDSIAGFTFAIVVITAWGVVIGSLTLPAWWWTMPGDASYLGLTLGTTGGSFLGVGVGLAALVPILAITRGFTAAHAHVARALLRPSGNARVEELTESRAGAVDAAHEELQRIERDLHDGAQARLVALAMDLGLAERKVAEDPAASRELIGEAREEAVRALGELRELVRGIGPSILRDRGLEAAVASLTAGRTQPVDARVDVGQPRPPATVEAAAYFVVAESIANAARHSGASRVTVRVWRDAAERIVVECTDDGQGGADPTAGSGLSGLIKRVRALDGTLTVTSPAGGPTTIRAEIPCGS